LRPPPLPVETKSVKKYLLFFRAAAIKTLVRFPAR
jgi:hypothetical protein